MTSADRSLSIDPNDRRRAANDAIGHTTRLRSGYSRRFHRQDDRKEHTMGNRMTKTAKTKKAGRQPSRTHLSVVK